MGDTMEERGEIRGSFNRKTRSSVAELTLPVGVEEDKELDISEEA